MQQLEYQTKTKNLTSLSRELLHSLIVLEDDNEDCDDEDVAVKDPEWLWHKFNRIIHYDTFTLQDAIKGLECLTLKIHQRLSGVDDPIIRENLDNVVKCLKENHLTLQNLIDESSEVALENLLN